VKDENLARTLGITFAQKQREGKLVILSQGDPVEFIKRKLKQIAEALEALKEAGIDMDILISYIQAETRLPRKTITAILNAEEKFFSKLGIVIE